MAREQRYTVTVAVRIPFENDTMGATFYPYATSKKQAREMVCNVLGYMNGYNIIEVLGEDN